LTKRGNRERERKEKQTNGEKSTHKEKPASKDPLSRGGGDLRARGERPLEKKKGKG